MPDARWKVGKTQPTTYGASQSYGYSFAIQNFHGAPLLNVTFATKEESEKAEAAVRKAIENAVDIMGYSGS
jgi:hypothetical protein